MSTLVVDDVAGMRDPLAADHELVLDRLAEAVAHAAVEAGEPDAARDGGGEVGELVLLDRRHGDRSARSGSRSAMAGIGEGRRCRARRGPRSPPRAACSATMAAHCSGSWPSQPPQTISARGLQQRLLEQGPGARAGWRSRRRGGASEERLEGLHHLEHMQRQRAAGAVRAVLADARAPCRRRR